METTLYDDDSSLANASMSSSKDSINSMKRNMKLDLDSLSAKKQKFSCLLSSPDLNMLKLGSPELERLIISQNNGLVTTTPTPTQYMFPKQATEEQEVYAKGFTDALAQLQTVHHIPQVTTSGPPTSSSAMLLETMAPSSLVQQSQIHQMNSHYGHAQDSHLPSVTVQQHDSVGAMIASSSSSASNSPFVPVSIKDEPQTVPSMGNTPPMSPIDMNQQEQIKLERKRQRNRLAASKCRRRKLERIAKLEDKVRILKGENNELSTIVTTLKEQVCSLKQEVIHHTRNGCQIMTTDISTSVM